MNSWEELLDRVTKEYQKAISKFSTFNTAHEGYAIIKEELDELWDEIKKKNSDSEAMGKEALQVATMALRFITDICHSFRLEACDKPSGNK
ncbi:MAG: hypothetical protein ACOC6D_08225 [Atribacterota bacterium]